MTHRSSMYQNPPQAPPVFTHTAASVLSDTQRLIDQSKALTESLVANVSADKATFDNVVLPLAQNENIIGLEEQIIFFLGSASPNSEVRDASTEAEDMLDEHEIEQDARKDVFKLIQAVYRKEQEQPSLDPESRRLLEDDYKNRLRMGLSLSQDSQREEFKNIQKRLASLQTDCFKNITEEQGGLWFTQEELAGIPDDVIETLKHGDKGSEHEGRMRLTFDRPDLTATQKYCTVADTRKKMFLGNENRCSENVPLFNEILELRDKAARLLGYPNHASMELEDKMISTPKAVNAFLNGLIERLAIQGEQDIQKLKQLKGSETGDGTYYYLWDHQYYDTLMLSRDFELDQNKVAEYFPLESCVTGMLDIFAKLIGLVFVKLGSAERDALSETGNGNDFIWHEDVHLYSVWNGAREGNGFVGYMYMDLHPREGKSGGTYNANLQPSFLDKEGQRRYPATTLMCNFTKPTAKKPSLLKHQEVVTLFHELGHGIHDLVARTIYRRFHGVRTVRDFAEAPSQMLENWCWTASQIKSLSKHWSYLSPEYRQVYLDSSDGNSQPEEKMPDSMIQTILSTRHVNAALAHLRQLHFGMFDMMVHQPESHENIAKLDTTKLYNQLRRKICKYDDLGDVDNYHWAHAQATFTHIIGGLDAGYYGYLASQVYSADMFTVFSNDPMDEKAGRRYRRTVLEPGGSKAPFELLREFLGREPSSKAFAEQLGVS